MTDHKATTEQWAQIASWKEIGSLRDACLLDLLDRVESLEASICQWRIDHLRLANACASMAPDRGKFFSALLSDGEDEHATEIN